MTFRHRVRTRKAPRRILKIFALGAVVTGSGLAGAQFVMRGDHASAPMVRTAEAPSVAPSSAPAPRAEMRYSGLFDPNYTLGFAQSSFKAAAPRPPAFETAAKVEYVPPPAAEAVAKPTPVAEAPAAPEAPARAQVAEAPAADIHPEPPKRPSDLTPARTTPLVDRVAPTPETPRQRLAARGRRSIVARMAPQEPSFFQRLFGGVQPEGPSATMAYANPGLVPNDAASIAPRATPAPRLGAGGGRAIYDISAQVVYMPDGTKLEAHSGLGGRRDDPRFVRERMRGATPPHVYNLRMRGAPFHGVRAIRLLPVGGSGAIFGRAGLLAHTYMLGPNGDSNGCVSFRDYNAFLNAFLSGQVTQLVVVDTMSNLSRYASR